MSLEDYTNKELINKGAWANVYRAPDHSNRYASVIIKVRDNRKMNMKDMGLFDRERGVLRQLDHPNIPKFLESGEDNGVAYFVMEDVGEQNLYQYMKKHCLDETKVIRLAESLADVLEYVHNSKPPVIHRDVNPANVVLRGDNPVLVDFGIVRDYIEGTQGGTTRGYGTAGYVPFEVLEGRVAPSSDIFSLGRLMVYMLTGKDPQ